MVVDIFNTDKKYSIIYADPPWKYKDSSCEGAAEYQYKTMTIEEICNLPVNQIADMNCILFLWATYPKLQEAMKVIDAWGFAYKTIGFQWIKLNKNEIGCYFGLGRIVGKGSGTAKTYKCC